MAPVNPPPPPPLATPLGVATGIFMWKDLIMSQRTGGGMGIVKLPQAAQKAAVCLMNSEVTHLPLLN